jgi:hypothetical protein
MVLKGFELSDNGMQYAKYVNKYAIKHAEKYAINM